MALVWILLFKFSTSSEDVINLVSHQARHINIIPFHESVIINNQLDISEIRQNSVIFIPFGGLLGIWFKDVSILKKIEIMGLFSLGIESMQYIFKIGAADMTDVITNLVGGMIGLGIYVLLTRFIDENALDKWLVWIGAILFSMACVSIVLLLLLN